MGFRLSFAFCFIAALGVVLGGVYERHRRHDRMRTGDWIARANAAAISTDDRTAVPILVELLDDANPRVRMNALWALNRLTGLPWATRTSECLHWWEENAVSWERRESVSTDLGRFEFEADFRVSKEIRISGGEEIGVIIRAAEESGRVDIIIHSRWPNPLRFESSGPLERYAGFLYRHNGMIARSLGDDQPPSCGLEARLTDVDGRRVARYWWTVLDEPISRDRPLLFSLETASLEPGEYAVEVLLGPAMLATYGTPVDPNLARLGFLSDIREIATFRR